jgi:tRNA/rRNA methyltransferase
LVEPSHPGNVGAVARAIKTMGFGELVLVAPRVPDVVLHPEAQAMASGADDVLAAARVVPDLDAALVGIQWSLALSARPREYGPPLWTPRQAASYAAQAAADASPGGCPEGASGDSPGGASGGSRIALVFGNERTGLANADVERCRAIAHIPANPRYSSLNLSQAVQVLAYELRLACLDQVGDGADKPRTAPLAAPAPQDDRWASGEEIAGMLMHLEAALVRIDFLDPGNPKKLMSRLRGLFSRSGLAHQEVNILRGVAKQILSRCRGDGEA